MGISSFSIVRLKPTLPAVWNTTTPSGLMNPGDATLPWIPAKSGDADAAAALVAATCSEAQVQSMAALVQGLGAAGPTLVSAHAYESEGVKAIPEAFADVRGRRLGWPVDSSILQVNVVSHTGADGWSRLARPAAFDGPVQPGLSYVLVDDFLCR